MTVILTATFLGLVIFEQVRHLLEIPSNLVEIWSKESQWVVAFRAQDQDSDFLLSCTREIPIAIQRLGCSLLRHHVLEVWICLVIESYECCVDDLGGQHEDCW